MEGRDADTALLACDQGILHRISRPHAYGSAIRLDKHTYDLAQRAAARSRRRGQCCTTCRKTALAVIRQLTGCVQAAGRLW